MFYGFGKETIHFFLDLRFHNDRAFMEENRERYYRDVRTPFYAFINEMAPVMRSIDADMEVRPVKCLSRINRDTRFSKDKSPYRDHLWVAFRQAAMDKDGQPFYWFELSPEHVSWGLGIWNENRPLMEALRRRMLARPEDFLRILSVIKEQGFVMGGREWKKLPIPEELPGELIPLYRKREVFLERADVPMESAFQSDICSRVNRDYQALAPLYRIFRGCVEEAMNQLDEQGGNV